MKKPQKTVQTNPPGDPTKIATELAAAWNKDEETAAPLEAALATGDARQILGLAETLISRKDIPDFREQMTNQASRMVLISSSPEEATDCWQLLLENDTPDGKHLAPAEQFLLIDIFAITVTNDAGNPPARLPAHIRSAIPDAMIASSYCDEDARIIILERTVGLNEACAIDAVTLRNLARELGTALIKNDFDRLETGSTLLERHLKENAARKIEVEDPAWHSGRIALGLRVMPLYEHRDDTPDNPTMRIDCIGMTGLESENDPNPDTYDEILTSRARTSNETEALCFSEPTSLELATGICVMTGLQDSLSREGPGLFGREDCPTTIHSAFHDDVVYLAVVDNKVISGPVAINERLASYAREDLVGGAADRMQTIRHHDNIVDMRRAIAPVRN